MWTLTQSQIKNGLKDRNSLVQFALKLVGPSNDTPEWFMPYYYRMGYSEETYYRLRESGLI